MCTLPTSGRDRKYLMEADRVGIRKKLWKVDLFDFHYRILILVETMVKISDLPRELTEEVLSRLPVTSLRAARLTCKKWNTLSKDGSFTRKHLSEAVAAAKKKQTKVFQVIMMVEHRVYLCSVNLVNSPSIERIGKLISLEDGDRVDISKIFHCDGLLLCIAKDKSRIVVWNPYCGQTRWIEPRSSYHILDRYAIGYEQKNKSCRSYKVLRFMDSYDGDYRAPFLIREFEIYDLNSGSWKVVDVTPDWDIESYHRGVSLKGNTYWFAQEKLPMVRGRVISDLADFLICFDFTRERFGPRLPLPFHSFNDTVTLSSVRDEQLAVLFRPYSASTMKIWISNKIEPNAVSWRELFLEVDMKPLTGFRFEHNNASFFVDEEKKVVMVLDKDRYSRPKWTRNIAYVVGENGYFQKEDLGESTCLLFAALVCSYVPSSVQI